MAQLIDALKRLQEIEIQLAEIRGEEELKLKRIRKLEADRAKLEGGAQEVHRRLMEFQSNCRLIELDLRNREEAIAKHREALTQTRGNREYSAILTSINTERADLSRIETQALERMGEVEQAQKQLGALEAQKVEMDGQIAAIDVKLKEYQAKIAPKREMLLARKAEAAKDVPPAWMATFDRVAQRHNGEAMAAVIRINPKREEFCCEGCNLRVTLEVVNSLKTRDEMQFCPSCGKVFYMD